MQRSAVWALVLVITSVVHVEFARAKPNILVFLSDDVGWAEYGFQGNKQIPTPNIDAIAKNGVRFTQGYVSGPYCSPTRAGLMTGRYQTRFGHEFNSVAGQRGLSLNETTIADRLKELGYATCAVGKWHLGGKPEYRPMKRGFDEFLRHTREHPVLSPHAIRRFASFARCSESGGRRVLHDRRLRRAGSRLDRKAKTGTPRGCSTCRSMRSTRRFSRRRKYLDRFQNIPAEKRQHICGHDVRHGPGRG